jgi:hypothetical protein
MLKNLGIIFIFIAFGACKTELLETPTGLPDGTLDSLVYSAEPTKSKIRLHGKLSTSGSLRTNPGLILSYKSAEDCTIDLADTMILGAEGIGPFTIDFTTVKPLKRFWYRTFAKNLNGMVQGEIREGFSFPYWPIVVPGTIQASGITESSATLTARLNSNGGDENLEKGFLLALATNPAITLNNNVAKVSVQDSTRGDFSLSVNGLLPNTKYFYVAYAKNRSNSIRYTGSRNFTTLP